MLHLKEGSCLFWSCKMIKWTTSVRSECLVSQLPQVSLVSIHSREFTHDFVHFAPFVMDLIVKWSLTFTNQDLCDWNALSPTQLLLIRSDFWQITSHRLMRGIFPLRVIESNSSFFLGMNIEAKMSRSWRNIATSADNKWINLHLRG